MQFRIPENFCDAKQAIKDSLEQNKLILSRYNSTLVNLCEVTHYHIKDEEDDERVGSVHLSISYKEKIITKYDKFETLNKHQELTILNPNGDIIWPFTMVGKVWEGNYPSGVAINEETGVVYLIYLSLNTFGLTEFAILSDSELESVKESLNEVKPYAIKLDEDAMFKVLAEVEGTRYLHETLCIEFDCGVKFKVSSKSLKDDL